MANEDKKVYLKGFFKASKKFPETLTHCSVLVEDFLKQMNTFAKPGKNGKQYFSFNVEKRKNVSEHGETHYIVVDQYVPKKKDE